MISKSKEPESWLYRTIKRSGYGLVATSLAFNYGCSHNASQDVKTTDEGGVIGKTLKDSKPFEPEKEKSIPGAPNVVWIVLDDVGFGATSAFGGLIETPNLDSLANNGLRYTNFHVEAYSAPTRAALLTGRNHHTVHVGLFPECQVEYPGYDGRIPFETGTAAEILRENGYNNFAVGKWHVTPVKDATQAGPFNRWPTGRGFDHFFGFLFAETDQFHPQLWENITKVETDGTKELNDRLADKAISYIGNQKSAAPDKPFFLYLATGAIHEPHQVAQSWRDKYKGKFDAGWDAYREKVLANQKKLGLIPQNASLPKNPLDRDWNSLSADEKKLYARFFENYAGYLSYTDDQVGRVVKYLKEIGQLENTAIFVLIGDNGASAEGTENGHITGWNRSIEDKPSVTEDLKRIDLIGKENSKVHIPRTWANATNTPFRLSKGNAQAEGGTHDPLIVFWPKGIKEKGGIRNQYTHAIDILPTTVELVGAKLPESINGYKQTALQGTSFFYSFNDAKAPSKHTTQYFEVAGRRAIYKDGWKAGANHKDGDDFNKDVWELYNINNDFNELHNLASSNPQKLKELQEIFDQEARTNNVYPLKDWNDSPWSTQRVSAFPHAKEIVLYPDIDQLPGPAASVFIERSFSITADAQIESAKTEGVLFAIGGSAHGLSLYVKDGKLQATLNSEGKIAELVSNKTIPTGNVKLRFELKYNKVEKGDAVAGTEAIFINNEKVGELPIKKYQAFIETYDEGIDVGRDLNYAVSSKYSVPFAFTGKLKNVTISLQ
jgi:arylsulfatase